MLVLGDKRNIRAKSERQAARQRHSTGRTVGLPERQLRRNACAGRDNNI
ncbi:hypothetical protein EFR01_55700 [Sinorhizobium fredii]|nr:hypothetical protein EFR01_55700 [Sinorhizobium fredii]GLS12212.1 hypothetical protein GCM10007864_58440 [Sinorhizobium fredii]